MTWQWWETDYWREHRWVRLVTWLGWGVFVLIGAVVGQLV